MVVDYVKNMNQKTFSIITGLTILITIFCSQTTSQIVKDINEQSYEDVILTITYKGDQKIYSLEELENMVSMSGRGGRLNSVGSTVGPFDYIGVPISVLANEFPSMPSLYTLTTIADDGYIVSYTMYEVQGNVQVYDTDGNEQGIGGVTMILAYEEEGIKDFPGCPLRIAFISDEDQFTDSFLWSKHVIEIEFFDISIGSIIQSFIYLKN